MLKVKQPTFFCSTPMSQISTAPGTPCVGHLDDFVLDDLKSSTGSFCLEEEHEEVETPAEGDIGKITAFLATFQFQPTEEDAEGDVARLIDFLNVFCKQAVEEKAENASRIIQFL